MFEKEIRLPIFALFFISLGGLLLHLRIHPPTGESAEASDWVPAICGFVTVFVLPFLFNKRSTVGIAYVINLAAVILGVVGMTYYSITSEDMQWTPRGIIIESTLADSLILLAKVPLGNMILRHFRPKAD